MYEFDFEVPIFIGKAIIAAVVLLLTFVFIWAMSPANAAKQDNYTKNVLMCQQGMVWLLTTKGSDVDKALATVGGIAKEWKYTKPETLEFQLTCRSYFNGFYNAIELMQNQNMKRTDVPLIR